MFLGKRRKKKEELSNNSKHFFFFFSVLYKIFNWTNINNEKQTKTMFSVGALALFENI